LDGLGSLSLFLGRLDEAAAYFRQGIAIAEEKLSIRDASYPLTNLSITQWLTGDFEQAQKTILMAVDFPYQISDFGVIFPNSGYIELLLISGRYREAAEKIEWFDECIDFRGWPYEAARLSRVSGWLALVDQRCVEAQTYFEAAIDRLPYDDESVAWSQAGLAKAAWDLHDREKARDLLTEALSTSVRIQCYIPMVFTLPMTLPILAEGDSELAIYVYRQIKSDPFMAKAQLFEDLVYQDLPDEVAGLTEIKIEGGPVRRKALWAITKLILEKLRGSQVEIPAA
jgi:tetratricopeptide (TPR) repeat protein